MTTYVKTGRTVIERTGRKGPSGSPASEVRRPESETIGGRPVTEGQIEAWAAEAADGFDPERLRRTGRTTGRSEMVSVRLDAALLDELDRIGAREGLNRSEAIRSAIRAMS